MSVSSNNLSGDHWGEFVTREIRATSSNPTFNCHIGYNNELQHEMLNCIANSGFVQVRAGDRTVMVDSLFEYPWLTRFADSLSQYYAARKGVQGGRRLRTRRLRTHLNKTRKYASRK